MVKVSFKQNIVKALSSITNLKENEILKMLERPPQPEMGDFAFPCFLLAKSFKKNPNEIALDLKQKISKVEGIEKIENSGPYLNFFVDIKELAKETFSKTIEFEKNKRK